MYNFIDAATSQELAAHYGYMPDAAELAAERAHFAADKDHNLVCLYTLALDRGDAAKAAAYLRRIANPQRRLEAEMLGGELMGA
ncbi:hypothetical protein [uncultured Desulfovibrio sp.]|uniref:hypothetical protein n=1 Tax=uncultured Desulfovibrio sp. TaxID=167968 RepID=UPI0026705434|nr:hypothetical protein [uncultured Desulfovibrio sp.]